jgi:polyisoprenyl-teichoic acid--peptidoglycan teichoic acid transferase
MRFSSRVLRIFWFMVIFSVLLVIVIIPAAAQTTEYVRPAWDGVSPFTVLIMGIDRRPEEPLSLNYRPDAIMLVRLDPTTQRVGILNIPRDLHFALADGGELVRVNSLLVRGESRQEGYGPFFMMDTLQYNLGLYIDTYVIFDFDAFITLVDAMGGIEMEITYVISDREFPDMDYGYDPLYLQVGRYQFDGLTALKYARTRHNDDDFQRGQRQLEVLEAIRAKAFEPNTLLNLVQQVPTLQDELQENIYTDIAPAELYNLLQVGVNIPAEQISTQSISKALTITTITTAGNTVRIPDREQLGLLLTDVFGENYWQ